MNVCLCPAGGDIVTVVGIDFGPHYQVAFGMTYANKQHTYNASSCSLLTAQTRLRCMCVDALNAL
jgi:hypothetical protein